MKIKKRNTVLSILKKTHGCKNIFLTQILLYTVFRLSRQGEIADRRVSIMEKELPSLVTAKCVILKGAITLVKEPLCTLDTKRFPASFCPNYKPQEVWSRLLQQ